MPRVVFTTNIQRHLACPAMAVTGQTVADALEEVFALNPKARGYILDDQGAVRKHIVIFVNGEQIADRGQLADPVPADGEIYVMQALSGG